MKFDKLGDISEIIDSLHKTPKYSTTGRPMVRGTDVKYGKLNLGRTFQVSEEVFAEFSKRYTPEIDDIIITRVGTYGITAQVKEVDFCLGQNTSAIKPRNINPDYLYLLMNSKIVKEQIEFSVVGSTQKTLSLKAISNIDIPRFGKEVEDSIADIGSKIDDKINNNTQTNQTLEAMAQAIFKSWFVDFDPVKAKMRGEQPDGMDADTAALFPNKLVESELGLIPEGWEVKPLGAVSTFLNGYAFKSKELTTDSSKGTHKVFKMGNIRKGGGFNRYGSKDYFDINTNFKVERYLLKKGDLLMSMTDMKNNVALLGHTALMPISDEFLVNQRVGLIRKSLNHYINFPFLYYQTNEPSFLIDIRSRANSGVQVNLSTKGIKDTLLIVPPKDVHAIFDKLVLSLLEGMFSNDTQSEELSKLRDTLLPKLLSGEIDLSEAKGIES